MKTYEGMFLLDAGQPDFEIAAAPVREVLDHVKAEILAIKPWDERRLAYEIKGRKRALYVLTYFRADPDNMSGLEHETQLNEKILRSMVFSADHLKEEVIQAETPAQASAARKAAIDKQRAEAKATREAAEATAAEAPAQPAPAETPAADAPAAEAPVQPAPPEAPAAEAPVQPAPPEAPPAEAPVQPAPPEAPPADAPSADAPADDTASGQAGDTKTDTGTA